MHMPTYRVISILKALANSEEGYTLSELTRQTGILTGTISPILKTLVETGFLEMSATGNKYKIGSQAYYTGLAFAGGGSVLELIRNEMEVLSKACNETCQLGILKEGEVYYLLKVEGKEAIRVVSEVGGSLPAYGTALGKAILSKYNRQELQELYPEDLQALTANTVSDLIVLDNQLDQVRKTGFAYEVGESSEYTSCIGVPIRQKGSIIAGLSVVYPSFRESEQRRVVIQGALIICKSHIEKILENHSLV